MAIKRIVRWKPSSPLYGRRELYPEHFQSEGIFTQERPLAWDARQGNWLDADEAGISAEALEWLLNNPDTFGTFTYEEQEVRERSTEGSTSDEKQDPSANKAPVEGESASASTSTKTTTTQSTARP